MDGRTDRLVPIYPWKHLFCRGSKRKVTQNYMMKSVFHWWNNWNVQIDSKSIFKKYFPLFLPKTNLKQNYHKIIYHEPFPRQHILDSSKLLEFVDNNFKFDKNGRKFSCRIENTVEKGEIAHYEQFLLFSHCFQKTITADKRKPGLVKTPFYQRKAHLVTLQDQLCMTWWHKLLLSGTCPWYVDWEVNVNTPNHKT